MEILDHNTIKPKFGSSFTISHFTGNVIESLKSSTTEVHGSGGGGYVYQGTGYNNPVNIKSTVTIQDQLFLMDENHNEKAFQLKNFNLACRSGHKLTIFTARKSFLNHTSEIAAYNHSTKSVFTGDDIGSFFYWLNGKTIFFSLATLAVAIGGYAIAPLNLIAAFFIGLIPFKAYKGSKSEIDEFKNYIRIASESSN